MVHDIYSHYRIPSLYSVVVMGDSSGGKNYVIFLVYTKLLPDALVRIGSVIILRNIWKFSEQTPSFTINPVDITTGTNAQNICSTTSLDDSTGSHIQRTNKKQLKLI